MTQAREHCLWPGSSHRSGWRESNPHHQLGNPIDRGLWPRWPGQPTYR